MKNLRFGAACVALLAVLAGAYLWLPASLGSAPPKHDDHDDHGEKAAIMTDAKLAAAGIELDKAGPMVLKETMRINGLLQANQELLAQVTPRFAGIVREVHKRIGDPVAKGDLLAKLRATKV